MIRYILGLVVLILLASATWSLHLFVLPSALAAGPAMLETNTIQPRKDQPLLRKTPEKVMPAPRLTKFEAMGDGYALIGSGFGTDKTKVQILEGRATLSPSAFVSVADERIVVRSRPAGIVLHSVVVSGRASNVLTWTHPTVSSIQPPQLKGPAVGQLVGAPRVVPATPKTHTFTTGALQMTGFGGGAGTVSMTTAALQMTGFGGGTTEVRLTSGALQMTGLGGGTGTVSMTTPALQMTGLRTGTVAINTGALQMTGLRSGTVSMTTKELRMTGLGE